jgi:hypothetical protein
LDEGKCFCFIHNKQTVKEIISNEELLLQCSLCLRGLCNFQKTDASHGHSSTIGVSYFIVENFGLSFGQKNGVFSWKPT